MKRLNLSRKTKFSGANGDREKICSSLQLTMSRIGNLTRLIHTLPEVLAGQTSCATLFKQ